MSKLHLDLFSGIGGFAIAAQACGYKTIGFCEREPYAQQILKEQFGAVLADADNRRQAQRQIQATGDKQCRQRPKLHDDIFNLDGADYAGVDLLTGGFPCQPFSVAGKRRGAEDDRAIWPEMLRVIREAKPTWIIGENVAGIVTMELDNILSDLESLGYSAWPIVIPACAVDARHRRDRVWIVAHSNDSRPQEHGLREPSVSMRPGEDVAHAASKQDDGKRGHRERGRDGMGRQEQAARRRDGQADHDGTGGQGEDVAHAISLRELQSSGSFADERRRTGYEGEDVAHADESSCQGNERAERGKPKRTEHQQHCGRQLEPAICGMADGLPEGLDGGARFCQWPEEDYATPRVTTGIKHRAHRLKGLGNSIVPNVACEIIRAIVSCGR